MHTASYISLALSTIAYDPNKGYLKWVDKEKALNYLHLSAPIAEASEKTELSSATKIVENFENSKVSDKNVSDGKFLHFLRDALINHMRSFGMDVITDEAEGQRVLDMAKEKDAGVRLQAKLSALAKAAYSIRDWLKGNKRGKTFTIELPLSTQHMVRKAMGRDFDSHNITANSIAHAKKNHGERGSKLNKNSILLRDEDFELIPYIMTAPDYVRKGTSDVTGRESIRFYKNLGCG